MPLGLTCFFVVVFFLLWPLLANLSDNVVPENQFAWSVNLRGKTRRDGLNPRDSWRNKDMGGEALGACTGRKVKWRM